ncbi:hypothetical protein FOZ62_031536 [Perkinsus olseni]|uniref:Uncharacterized protein n=3 Tax=Perkinsus olseni TaxID=32597 RepID=A0A7J6UGM5_PEROL|nr:hypothetical protein FOZ62_031536 [Perkinsus olseni]
MPSSGSKRRRSPDVCKTPSRRQKEDISAPTPRSTCKIPFLTTEDILSHGAVVNVQSVNYPDLAWGVDRTKKQLKIVSRVRGKGVLTLKVVRSSSNPRAIAFRLVTQSDIYVAVHKAEGHLTLRRQPNPKSLQPQCWFLVVARGSGDPGYVLQALGSSGEREFVRHCNYWLQCDAPPDPQSHSRAVYEGDTAWLFVNAESCRDRLGDLWMHVVAPKPYEKIEAQIVKCRAVFGDDSENACRELERVVDGCDIESSGYEAQGAGAMPGVAGVMFASPLEDEEISEELMERVGTAGPLKRRGGIKTFKNMNDINPEAVPFIRQIDARVRQLLGERNSTNIRRMGLAKEGQWRQKLKLCFLEFIHMAAGSKGMARHRDGGNDSDLTALFCIRGSAECKVENEHFVLNEGDMYIFEPHKYFHSVGPPMHDKRRIAVACRYFLEE